MLVSRLLFLVTAAVVMLMGLASRRYRDCLPDFLAEYSGDTLWALMLFWLVSFVLVDKPVTVRWLVTALLATAIEVSQLYHAPWLDSIRATTPGGLVLGHGFLWTDLVCYAVGITIGALAEIGLTRLMQNSQRPTPA